MRPRFYLTVFALVFLVACATRINPSKLEKPEPAIRLAYFANLTHATAIAGIEKRFFTQALGPEVELVPTVFNAGPDVVTAIFSDAIDIAYIGPNPALNAFVRSKGEAVSVIAGSTSGGAYLIVQPGIDDPAGLGGKKVATPQLGNTQDVALKTWLADQRLEVSVVNQDNSQTLETFRSGEIAGAWVPEPWASRLVIEAGGKVLVDERDLWPDRRYVTTLLIVRKAFLESSPSAVESFLRGHVKANEFVASQPREAKKVVNDGLIKLTGKRLSQPVLDRAWGNLDFTVDPIRSSLETSASNAEALGLIDKADLNGLFDLELLEKVQEG